MAINYENYNTAKQTDTINKSMSLTSHYFGRSAVKTRINDMSISFRTRLLCIAAAFALALTAMPAPS